MKHTSIKMNTPCEFINVVPFNPQISKCQIKVCYVGDSPNRNKTIISKETAYKLANSLPGSPIVGYFNKETNDFESHNKNFIIEDGQLKLGDATRPYGFVDLNARCWFQKYIDDETDEREYLMTEGYLWTGQYPDCNRVITQGNNQSMTLDEATLDGYWTKDSNQRPEFFIINDALISKLCILGEDYEPCFEGSNITEPKIEFSLDEEFKTEVKEMIHQMQEILKEGDKIPMIDYEKKKDEDKEKDIEKKEEEEVKEEDTKEQEKDTDNKEQEQEQKKDDEDEKKKKKEYSLDEIPEYIELKTQYSNLENKYNELVEQTSALTDTISSLKEFKLSAERKEKQALIDQFCMLSDKDKEDVVTNIDNYSLEDIENKLAVLCFRNKVNFNFDEEAKEKDSEVTTFNLNEVEKDTTPAWVKAVAATQSNM